MTGTVLVVDFGAQYAQLIARRVREAHVHSEIVPRTITASEVKARDPVALIFSGGPASVYADDAYDIDPDIVTLGVPILGICYGHQVLAQALGGTVERTEGAEYGRTGLDVHGGALFAGAAREPEVWMSHRDSVTTAPEGFEVTASTATSPVAAMEDATRRLCGVQFHPEVAHTAGGQELLERFLYDVAGAMPTWTHTSIIESQVDEIRGVVGSEQIICGLSGGVDSAVAAALVHKAVGDQLTCVFVDHGLLRLREGDQVMATFAEHMHINVIRVNAEDQFMDALKGVSDPEDKRKVIGREFIKVFEKEAGRLKDIAWLAQGTIYPDVIESAGASTGKAHVIKSHHNVGGLPERMKLKLLEPLRELFKDEVREIGLELGLPADLINRHPFPGPGLGVRILGEVNHDYAELLRKADAIYIDELRDAGLYDKTSQAFAVFLPVRSVGVMGDGRRYEWVIALRAVETIDFMTARWAELPFTFLDRVSRRIINEVDGVSRVVYDISGKPPATIEWE